MLPIIAWVIIAFGGTLAVFGKSAFGSLCGLPIIRGFQSCQPTLYDWISFFAPYAIVILIIGA